MNYHTITTNDLLNGDGLRTVLWVAGCPHNCPGCHNSFTHDFNSGQVFTGEAEQRLLKELDKDHISGVTFSGGDPMALSNRSTIYNLARKIKEKYPQKTIWLYTGYTFEDIKDEAILSFIDVLVDGKFIWQKAIPSPKWCGSRNQRVINVKESLKRKKVILHV